MIRAPDAGNREADLVGELHSMNRVTTAALDGRNVESEDIASLMSAANVESSVAALEMALVCWLRS